MAEAAALNSAIMEINEIDMEFYCEQSCSDRTFTTWQRFPHLYPWIHEDTNNGGKDVSVLLIGCGRFETETKNEKYHEYPQLLELSRVLSTRSHIKLLDNNDIIINDYAQGKFLLTNFPEMQFNLQTFFFKSTFPSNLAKKLWLDPPDSNVPCALHQRSYIHMDVNNLLTGHYPINTAFDYIVATFSIFYPIMEANHKFLSSISNLHSVDKCTNCLEELLTLKEKMLSTLLEGVVSGGYIVLDEPTYRMWRAGFSLIMDEFMTFSDFLNRNGYKVNAPIKKISPIPTGIELPSKSVIKGCVVMNDLRPGVKHFTCFPLILIQKIIK
ncbi:hypothetical protein [Endozoicomonas sp. Mp262]|uniref:hypothetical protein n=1 Tax=Endozoicomonas sp. Mp262 TaxID=2919499 RepID=UPI0021DA4F10